MGINIIIPEIFKEYGWVILTSIIAIGVLAYFGVFHQTEPPSQENPTLTVYKGLEDLKNPSLVLSMGDLNCSKFLTGKYYSFSNSENPQQDANVAMMCLIKDFSNKDPFDAINLFKQYNIKVVEEFNGEVIE